MKNKDRKKILDFVKENNLKQEPKLFYLNDKVCRFWRNWYSPNLILTCSKLDTKTYETIFLDFIRYESFIQYAKKELNIKEEK